MKIPLTNTGNPKEDGFTSRVVLSYAPNDDVLLFAEVSEGFRYGAVNEPVASNFCGGLTGPVSFGSDELTNYALGAKSQLADQRATLNANVAIIIANPGGAFPGYEDSRFHGSPRTIGTRGKVNF